MNSSFLHWIGVLSEEKYGCFKAYSAVILSFGLFSNIFFIKSKDLLSIFSKPLKLKSIKASLFYLTTVV